MPELVIKAGACSLQGLRSNNEDRFVVDREHHVYLVADGMGGQEAGERASGLAAEIIPRVVQDRLAAHQDAGEAAVSALDEANKAIINASRDQAAGRRMGTTAVLAVQGADHRIVVAALGDSRAYLIRGERVDQLTIDHTVADALERNGTLTHEQARQSPWRNVLYKFLGCAEMSDGPDVRPFEPKPGDRLLLATDGVTNFVTHDDLRQGVNTYPDPQRWAEYLVDIALRRGSRDNVTCVVVDFRPE